MSLRDFVHVIAVSSHDRAEQARACYALGFHAEIYGNYAELVAVAPARGIVLAEDLAERGGVTSLLAQMQGRGFWLPVIATAHDASMQRVVEAVRTGAMDYLELPLEPARLEVSLRRVTREAEAVGSRQRQAVAARARLADLTPRENEVLDLLVAGSSNKTIARELQISPRTVEIHRANMMAKLGASHAADAVRLRLEAGMGAPDAGEFRQSAA